MVATKSKNVLHWGRRVTAEADFHNGILTQLLEVPFEGEADVKAIPRAIREHLSPTMFGSSYIIKVKDVRDDTSTVRLQFIMNTEQGVA